MVILTNRYNHIDMVTMKKFFINILNKEYQKEKYGESIQSLQINQMFTDDEVYDAIHSIYIKGDRLEIPERGKNSDIMRYLEFGGEGVRPMHLISRSLKQLRIIGGM